MGRRAASMGMLVGVAMFGCGGGDGSGAPAFTSRLPDDQQLASLTQEEADTLCDDLVDYDLAVVVVAQCRLTGLLSAIPGGACLVSCTSEENGSTRCDYTCDAIEGEQGCSYTCAGASDDELERDCSQARTSACSVDNLSDSELRQACASAQENCERAFESAAEGGGARCKTYDVSCQATVADLEACITEQGAQTEREQAGLPTCASVTKADLRDLVASAMDWATDPEAAMQEVGPACGKPDARHAACSSGRMSLDRVSSEARATSRGVSAEAETRYRKSRPSAASRSKRGRTAATGPASANQSMNASSMARAWSDERRVCCPTIAGSMKERWRLASARGRLAHALHTQARVQRERQIDTLVVAGYVEEGVFFRARLPGWTWM